MTHFIGAAATCAAVVILSQTLITPPWRAPTDAGIAVAAAPAPVHPAWSPPAQVASVSLPEPIAVRAVKTVQQIVTKPKPRPVVHRAPPNTQIIYPFGIR